MATNDIPVSMRLPDALLAELHAEREGLGLGLSAYIRQILQARAAPEEGLPKLELADAPPPDLQKFWGLIAQSAESAAEVRLGPQELNQISQAGSRIQARMKESGELMSTAQVRLFVADVQRGVSELLGSSLKADWRDFGLPEVEVDKLRGHFEMLVSRSARERFGGAL